MNRIGRLIKPDGRVFIIYGDGCVCPDWSRWSGQMIELWGVRP